MDENDDEDFVTDLRNMSDKERETEIGDLVATDEHKILDADAFCDAMAETNASGFTISETSVDEVRFENGECIASITYSAKGGQDGEKMYYGHEIYGTAEAVFEADGRLSFRNVTAEIDHGEDE